MPTGIEEHDPYWDYDENDCANCGGEGFVYGCSWDWQCETWDGESCLCERRCEWCNPPKLTAEAQELYNILAQAIEARQGGDAKQAPSQDESAVSTGDAP